MYEETWYSFVPDLRSKAEVPSSQVAKHRRRGSLLKQTNGQSGTPDREDEIIEFFKEPPKVKGPPQVKVVRRTKSLGNVAEALGNYASRRSEDLSQTQSDLTVSECKGSDFEQWYEDYEEDLLDASHEEYQLYRDQLALSERHLDTLLENTTSALDLLATLSASFKAVEAQTTAFQSQCEDLLAEQKRIRGLANEVGTDLQYYAYLEPLTRRLNAPGAGRLVRNDDFLEMLETFNDCIEFMDLHPTYRDSTSFKTRYSALLERALNLVQTSFTNALREVTDDVTKQLAAKDHNETTEYILLYGKYETAKEKLGDTVDKLLTTDDFAFGREGDQKNRSAYGPQYHNLYSSLLEAYIKSRDPVVPLVLKSLRKFAPKSSTLTEADLKVFARRCIQWVFDTCHNEISLVEKYFKDGPLMTQYSEDLVDWKVSIDYLKRLEQTCLSHIATLHSFLTPYLNKGDLHRLCDLVNWLETTYMGSPGDNENIAQDGHILAAQALLGIHLWPLLDQQFISAAAEFEHFRPSHEDLKVEVKRPTSSASKRSSFSLNHRRMSGMDQSIAAGPGVPNAYPTVQKAINLLIMYNDSMFDRLKKGDVLYEIVHQTTESLQKAATSIKRTTSIQDAQIFLIKNLMLIENLFLTHEIPDSVRQSAELDFSPIWNTIKELQDRKQVMNPLAYIRPLVKGNLLPAVRDQVLDARKELEKVLVQQITAFTKTWQGRLKGPMKGTKSNVTPREELDALLEKSFEDDTTRRALLRMILADEA